MSFDQTNDPFEAVRADDPLPPGGPGGDPRRGRKLWVWLIGIFGGVCLLGVLACCGGGYWMLGVVTDMYRDQLNGNAVISEHLGEIESMELDFARTAEESDNPDCDLACRISGSLGSGVILIKQDRSGDGTGIESAVLVLPDGSRYDVPVGRPLDPPLDTEFEVDLGDELGAEFDPLESTDAVRR